MVTLLRFLNITPAATAQKINFSTANSQLRQSTNPHLLKKTYSFIKNFTALLQILQLYYKETLAQLFPTEFCKFS